MSPQKAIIIGSGIAGMATAIRLAVQGFEVTVFEANAFPGGKLSLFEKDGFRFDAGPSLFTEAHLVEELFELADEPMENYFSYQQLDTACHYFFENGKRLKADTDKDKLDAAIATQLGEKPGTVKDYLSRAEKLYDDVGHIFLNFSLHKTSTWIHKRVWKAVKAVRWPYLFSTLNEYNQSRFKQPETVQLFNRYATYNGSNPFKAPGMLSLIPHLEFNTGTFYPKGGMISITNALYALAQKKGVVFQFNHKVQSILQEGKKAVGVEVNQKQVRADVVVSNGDVYYTYKHLLKNEKQAARLQQLERSSSALIFYWGIQHQFEELGLHNILFTRNYSEEFAHIFEKQQTYHDPTIYINITSKMEAGHTPGKGENWFVMVNAPADNGQDWSKLVKELRKQVVLKINRMLNTDIEPLVATEIIMDPLRIAERTGTFKGSLYGTSSNSKWAAFFRPANFDSGIKNLYCCGGTVHPGGGIPLCLKSAAITADLINKDYGHQ